MSCSGKGHADMGSDSQTLQQARKLIGQRDCDGAIDLLSPIDDPSPDQLFALAEAYFLKATSTEDGRKSRAAYREAMKLFPQCYADCAKPRQACREWAYCARVLEDEDELKRAKEAGLAISGDAQLVVIHYFLKLDQNAPPKEREDLIDEALRIDPNEPNALSTKASFLIRKGQWKRAYELKRKAINHFSDLQRTHPAFPDLLGRTALLALIRGDDWEAHLEWAKDENRRAPWVIVAHRIVGMDAKKERVQKAKELLTGAKQFREFEGTFDEWLGEPVEAEVDEGEQEDGTREAWPENGERYTVSSIEQMTPVMREELIVRLLAEGMTRVE